MPAESVLVIVPCGKGKVWDNKPRLGRVRAADAYTGTLFRLSRRYAERFGDAWVVLSAKYGFISPEFLIPGPYDVTFKHSSSGAIAPAQLRSQIDAMGLARYSIVVGLGGAAYREAVTAAFAPYSVRLAFPFTGLPLGQMLHALKGALQTDQAGFNRDE